MNTTVENFVLDALSQKELNDIVRKHQMFLTGKPGGARAYVKDKDLTGLNLKGAQLQQSDFTGCVFRKANMRGINLESATLFGCDLSLCELQKANLSRSDLRGADIQQSNLTDANLSGADLRAGASILKRKIRKADDVFGRAKAGHVTFNGSILYNVSLKGVTAINADFSDALMENANLEGADLRDASFKAANLTGAQLDGADLRNANFYAAMLMKASMENTEKGGTKFSYTLKDDTGREVFDEVALSLDELILKHTQWVGSAGKHGERMDLSRYDMRKLESLAEKKLTAIIAEETIFAAMNLQNVNFQSARLNQADFRHSDLRNADCRGAKMNECVFVRTNIQKANFGPLVFKQPNGEDRIVPCSLKNSSFRYANFRGSDFRYADFTDADLTHADFTDCDLRNADFTNAEFEETTFHNALTTGAKFDPDFKREPAEEQG